MADYSASSWNEADASNTSASPDGLPTGAQPSALAPRLRAMAGAAKRSWDRINAAFTSTGSATALVLTYSVGPASYFKGERFAFWASATNTGAMTININGLGARSILRPDGSALIAGDIISGTFTELVYDGTNFRLATMWTANPTFTGTVTAPSFSGSGAALTNLNASNLASGILPNARVSGAYNGITNLGMAGLLTNVTNSEALRLQAATTGNDPFMTFYEADGATRRGYIQHRDGAGTTNGLRFVTDASANMLVLTNDVSANALQFYNSATSTYSTIWHAGNDGAGSGLDADLLDGLNSTNFFRNNADFSTTGNLTLTNSAPNIVMSDTTAGSYNTRIVVDANNWLLQKQADGTTTWSTFMQFEMDTTNTYANGSQIWTDANSTTAKINGLIGYTPANSAISVVAGNGMSGGGTLAASRTLTLGTPSTVSATTTNSVTSTSHTHDFDVTSLFYTGSTVNNVTFPVGSYLLVAMGQAVSRNAAVGVALYSPNNEQYVISTHGSAGAVVAGVWRSRSTGSESIYLVQRVS